MPPGDWIDELRAERVETALDGLRKELETSSNYPSNYYSLGAVYMWLGHYQAALAHFDEQIRANLPRNPPGDLAYGMAGAAAWCMRDEKSALKYWRKGTTPGYAVAGSNTRTSLLLYAASVLTPNTFSAETVDGLLRKKVNHWRVKNWPGPIAQYIIGAASEDEVRPKAVYRNADPAVANPKSWQFDFYKLLKASASVADGMLTLQSGLRRLVDVKSTQYLAEKHFFYFLRLEEFYLAGHWLSRSDSQLT